MMESTSPALAFVGTLDVSENRAVYLCELDDGRFLRLSKAAHDLYRAVESGASFAEIAATAQRANDRPITAVDVEIAYQKVLDRISVAAARGKQKRTGFWLQFKLIPASHVTRLGRLLSFAYHPAWAAIFVAAIAAGIGSFVTRDDLAVSIGPATFWTGYLVFLGSLLAHEFGHAAACARYGATPGPVGATMYLFYPAFYSDVTAAWSLRRWQRVVVDLGGTYFQLIAAAGISLAYRGTGWEPLRIAVLLIAGATLMSLNPILKFDGYWVVADALGVSNLSQLPVRLIHRGISLVRRRPSKTLPWSKPTIWLLIAYSVGNLVFWGWLLSFMGGAVTALADSYPATVAAIWRPLVGGTLPGASLLVELLTATFMLVFIAMMLYQLGSRLVKPLLGSALRLLRVTGRGRSEPNSKSPPNSE